jgi:ribosomal protein S18 acetylase RimI-like enzyme
MTTKAINLTYRKASIADEAQQKEVMILAYSQYSTVLTPDNWEKLNTNLHSDERFRELIHQSTGFVCCDGDKIVGAAYLVSNGHPTPLFQSDWSYIRMVGVIPGYGGHGIAKTLTKLCVELAKETGENIIALHTSEYMDAARHIYEKLGFSVLKEIDPILGKRYWIYTLELS